MQSPVISILRLISFLFLTSMLSAQVSTIYVDSYEPVGGNGTIGTPYRTLTMAIDELRIGVTWSVPAIIKIAGRGTGHPYTHDSVSETESFPIAIPKDVVLVYWDPIGSTPPVQPLRAVFVPGTLQPNASPCFRFNEVSGGTIPEGIQGFMKTSTLHTIPDTDQGIVISEFILGIEITDSTQGGFDLVLDYVAFLDCQRALTVNAGISGFSQIAVNNSYMRTAITRSTAGNPLVDVFFNALSTTGPHSLSFSMSSADMRPGNSGMASSMLVVRGIGDNEGDDSLSVILNDVMISGQPTVPGAPLPRTHGGPNYTTPILGAGIEVGVVKGCHGNFSLSNVTVRDAMTEGFLGYVQSDRAIGFLSADDCSFQYNGGGTSTGSYIQNDGTGEFSGANAEQCGLHLIVAEQGKWLVNKGKASHFSNNYRHGVFLEATSYQDEKDGFPMAEFDLCTFAKNGGTLPNEPGYGLLAKMVNATVELGIHRSLVSFNHTGGVRMNFQGPETPRKQILNVTNTTISGNEGENGDPLFVFDLMPLDIAPISIESGDVANGLLMHISQATLTNNISPYALTLHGATASAQLGLWSQASFSTVDNSILNKNGYNATGMLNDQAFFPEPQPFTSGQWDWIMDATWYSNLGSIEDGNVSPRYNALVGVNGNTLLDPQLGDLVFLNYFVQAVIPGLVGPMVDSGSQSPRYAVESTDNRGPGFPRLIPIEYDVGAFEVN